MNVKILTQREVKKITKEEIEVLKREMDKQFQILNKRMLKIIDEIQVLKLK